MQADHRAWFACKFPSGSRTYVSNAKLDKIAQTMQQSPSISHKTRVRAFARCPSGIFVSCGKGQTIAVWAGGVIVVGRPFDGVVPLPGRGRDLRIAFFGVCRPVWRLRCRCRGRSRSMSPGKGGISRGGSLAEVELGLRLSRFLAGGVGSSPPKRPKNLRRGERDDSPEVRFTASSRLPVMSLPSTASRYLVLAMGTASTTSLPARFFWRWAVSRMETISG